VPIAFKLSLLCLLAVLVAPVSGQNAGALFDDSVLHDIFLEMSPTDWETLKANFSANTYYPGNLRWRDQTVQSVGIRSRGGASRSGDKPGLRVDFDRYERRQTFLSLKSVVLDNSTQDPSLIKERLVMSLFRQMGIPAPRMAHTRLYVNGQFAGVYAIIEPIDKDFLMRQVGENTGYLYEFDNNGIYGFEYLGDDGSLYIPSPFEPETHEDDPKPEFLVAFIRFVNEAGDEDFQRRIGEFLNVEKFATYLAVETFISEIDGFTGFDGMNNFYVYRFNGANRWEFFPWDKDLTFSDPTHSVTHNFSQNVLIRRLMNLPEFRDALVGGLTRLSDIAGGAGGWLEQELDRAADQIRTAAYADTFHKCPGTNVSCSAEYFEITLSELRQFISLRNTYVANELHDLGMIP